ncbi:MAG: hypothetical protein DI538_24255 [Azospira oryzae]|nr:MAG: hypothetical protein DI538_24255 [Azospira oryzae]
MVQENVYFSESKTKTNWACFGFIIMANLLIIETASAIGCASLHPLVSEGSAMDGTFNRSNVKVKV